MRNVLVSYSKFAVAMLIVDWVLGAGRFAFPPLVVLFAIVNFPTGFLFLWLEQQTTPWWQAHFGLDDEIGQFVAFFGMILLQAGLIQFLCRYLRSKGRTRDPKDRESLVAGGGI